MNVTKNIVVTMLLFRESVACSAVTSIGRRNAADSNPRGASRIRYQITTTAISIDAAEISKELIMMPGTDNINSKEKTIRGMPK